MQQLFAGPVDQSRWSRCRAGKRFDLETESNLFRIYLVHLGLQAKIGRTRYM